ncbi:interferon-inducible GTPase-domain-containing protein [Kalaharituber pfeilii]|nr:interferon-inducible GTPase-domain-containing protein [Kalaharituber pfeilii]
MGASHSGGAHHRNAVAAKKRAAERKRREKALKEKEEALRCQKEENERMQREMQQQAEHNEKERQQEREQLQREQERMLAELREKEEAQKAAAEELERHHREREELLQSNLRLLQKGVSPKVWPTEEEWVRARQILAPGEGKVHCAITGIAGSGKSSLVNAFRGLYNKDMKAAEVGVTETTSKITYYPDPSTAAPRNQFVWYDVPGAGTLSIPGPQYFNAHGLFIFDLIIVVMDTRFTTQDIAILQQCEYFKIPSLIVRSKANQHLSNIMHEQLGYDTDGSDAEEEVEDYNIALEKAKRILIDSTRDSVRTNLEEGELNPDKRVYIVSADCVRRFSLFGKQGEKIKKMEMIIDEWELMQDLVEAISKPGSN